MTKEREALKMALESLEAHADIGLKSDHVITAIKEALAQPERKYTTTRNAWTGKATHKCNVCGRDDFRTEHAAKFHTCAVLAQPEQDGVAMADYMAILEKYVALKAEQPKQKPMAIEWTLNGDKSCGYNNWVGNTPFGRILITWKGWKKHHDACVDEFPGEFNAYGTPDEVKAECEAEFARRLNTTSPQRKPLTDEEISGLRQQHGITSDGRGIKEWTRVVDFTRAIEAAHGIKGEA